MDLVLVFYYIHFSCHHVEEEGARVGLVTRASKGPSLEDQLPGGGGESVGIGPGSQPAPHRVALTPGRWAGWPCTGPQVQGTNKLCGCFWSTRLLWTMWMR